MTGGKVTVAYVDQGYTGERPADAAAAQGIALEVVALPAAKRGFVLLPRRWVVERCFAWTARFRRFARDYERLPETVAGLHFVAFAGLMLRRAGDLALVHSLSRHSNFESDDNLCIAILSQGRSNRSDQCSRLRTFLGRG